jgi:hypothetical protein
LPRSDWFWAILLIVLNLALFADALFTNKTFFFRDVSFFHYPLKWLVTEAYSSGEWPLWNPYIQLGQPLLANPNCMAFYPTQVLFQILPFELAFELHFVLHCIGAGLATYFLGRTLGFSRCSAFVAAAVYNFSGVTLSFVNLFNILPVVTFLPLLTLLFLKLLQRITLWRMAATSLVSGAFLLLLEPLSSFAIGLFLAVFLAAFWFWSGQTRVGPARAIGCLLIVFGSSLLLAAVQLLPTFELIQHSGRRGGLDLNVVTGWSMPPINLLEMLSPQIFGDFFRLTQNSSWASSFFENREPYLLSSYFGLFALLLVLFGVFFSNKKFLSASLLVLSVVGVLFALGKYSTIYPWMIEHFHPFRFGRYPVKYLLMVNFCLAILTGFGLQRFDELRRDGDFRLHLKTPRFVIFAAFLLLLALLLFVIAPMVTAGPGSGGAELILLHMQDRDLQIPRPLVANALRHLQIQLGAFILFLSLGCLAKVRQPILLLVAGGFLVFDLLIHNFWINPLINNELYEPAPAALYLKERMTKGEQFRIYSWPEDDPAKSAAMLGSSDSIVWSYFFRKLSLTQFLAAKDHIEYAVFNPVDRLETLPSQLINAELFRLHETDERLQFLAGLNVGYIASTSEITSSMVELEGLYKINSPEPLRLYRLPRRLERVFLTNTVAASDESIAFRDMLSIGEQNSGKLIGKSTTNRAQAASGNARVLKYSSNQVEIEAEAQMKQTLVLLDSFYPGWRATVDGKQVPLFGANFVYRAIDLAPGKHRIVFSYHPSSFYYGLSISLLTLTAWLAILLAHAARSLRTKNAASNHV